LTGDLLISDNCTADGSLTVASSDVSAGTCPIVITRTYTVTDECGNVSADIVHTINVDDTTDPTASCQDIAVQLDAMGNVTITAQDIDNGSSDNCAIDTMWLDVYSFDCTDIGLNVVNLTVRDFCGFQSTCPATVTVEDNISPVISCQGDTTVTATAGNCSTVVNGIGPQLSSDNCSVNPVTFRLEGSTESTGSIDASGTSFNKGITTVWYKITDQSDNADSCSFNVTVLTTIVPPDSAFADHSRVCPGDGDIQLMYSGGVMIEGGTAMWYDDAGLTNNIGSGNPLVIPAPSVPTTYSVRFEGYCDTTSSVSTTVDMKIGSVVPESVSSNRDNICPGDGTILLSYAGGILGTGATARWYSDTLSQMVIGMDNDLSLPAPFNTTEYFVRFEGDCDSTDFVGTSVNIKSIPVPPDTAYSDRDSVCPGDGNVVLSYSGGDPGSNGTAVWYADPAMTVKLGTGNDLSIAAPEFSATYFMRFEADCDTSITVSAEVVVVSIPDPTFAEMPVQVCINGPLYRYVVVGQAGSLYSWNITNGNLADNLNDTIYVDWGTQIATGVVEVTETSIEGCVSSPVTLMVNISGPILDLGEDAEICMGDQVTIDPDGDFPSYLWQDGTTGRDFTTDQEGWITLRVTDSLDCTAIDSVYLTVHPLPVVDLGPDTSLCGSEALALDGGEDGVLFNWSTGDNSRTISIYQGELQEIWVEVESAFGCLGSDTVIVDECIPDIYFRYIPTAITPNGDGVNDVWNVEKLAPYSEVIVEIFDRWGTLVWRSEPGYSEPWDGRNMNGELVPMDSYHFVFKLGVGSRDRHTGVVTVIR
jgi:gliding motility-associated-like protein